MQIWKQFENNPLTHSAAHYLMTIDELTKEHGYARLTDVAKKLDITNGSASLKVKNLKEKGLIKEDDKKFLKLSKEGLYWVQLVEKNDKLFETFFRDILGASSKQAEIDACKIEHLISPETCKKLCSFLEFMQGESSEAKKFIETFQAKKSHCGCLKEKGCGICVGEGKKVNVVLGSKQK